jgi:hypothetical protein
VSIAFFRKLVSKLPAPLREPVGSLPHKSLEALAYAAAPLIGLIARTGIGTDRCLKFGALPMQVHFYSPIPDLAALEQANVWERRSDMPGVDLRAEEQLVLLARLGAQFGPECDWPAQPDGSADGYHTENNSFSFTCSAALHGMVRQFRPARVIEVGSGNSTRVLAAALQKNAAEGQAAEFTVIDPFPGERVSQGIPGLTRVKACPVEQVGLEIFSQLESGDILFIDSGHTVRVGSDVNFLFLEVLPRLAPGVIIHVHDIPMPFEYAKVYATNPQFRVFWTESYLLQAFLAFNREFEVLLAMAYLHADHPNALTSAFPHYRPDQHRATSGSFWIRRVAR